MNLIQRFLSNNQQLTPDMAVIQRGSLAHQLKLLINEPAFTVGHLFALKEHATTEESSWPSLSCFFDETVTNAAAMYERGSNQVSFMTNLCDAVYLIEKHKIAHDTTLKTLILDDDQFIEADATERNIHHKLSLATAYANEF
ncbi:hypothetical protein [Vibrio parahaemolyticus]|uniref:hypothetical protein n=1 Tax=Vibrio parahaemolyticus TaxID=670 RepID=UPI003D81AFBF